MKFAYLPNTITILRILLVFPVLYVLFQGNYTWGLYLFLIAGITDAVDGFLARQFNWSTRFGSIADPIADKFLMLATFVMLTYLQVLPIWLILIVIIRDLIIINGGLAYHYLIGPYRFAPSFISKINTFLQLMLITLVLFHKSYNILSYDLLEWLMYTVYLTNVLSLIHYVWVWGKKAIYCKKEGFGS